ncbi:MAG: aldehyde dehydrogenase [Bacteroidales bacterium]|jgi:aldehyde dehydrogenase (NAD+)|nr:aldehyde dehydrogenase [Bacteroidales bacterium]MDD2687447.1 aldehyde dehydrogenase [Bacteroidales bacterium]MDD3692253.1 aldehyde dehydrogenase [Bacteroidales bacterium]MDD4045116.1 aldehyde dehydrogenase [Bacteroidales bacterium]MDD4582131.1 aldehyde dehydrogenase [Bacteroidales bacterium]
METREMQNRLQQMRQYFNSQRTKDVSFRIQSLQTLYKQIKLHEQDIIQALHEDLHKSPFEAFSTEIGLVLKEIKHHIKHVKQWQRPEKKLTPFLFFPSKSNIFKEPYGLALIIAPWNYPFQLLFSPLVGAISAGNCVVLKTSPSAPATAKVMDSIISACFSPDYVSIFHGNREMNQLLLSQRFDYIFYTGSPAVGKVVMKAAAEHLTPITLELGGKSPCIVDKNADIRTAARRIMWGKTINAGQTCIAPDYLFVHKSIKNTFITALQEAVHMMFGDNPQAAPDYPRIVSPTAMQRLIGYIDKGNIVFGGRYDLADKYIEPTVVDNLTADAGLLSEEIFGPIFPLMTFDDIQEVITYINEREKPLALYFFSKDKQAVHKILGQTSSGGICINDTIIHVANHRLPFGGVGNSGMGAYHGKYSFDTFTHKKATVVSSFSVDFPIKYPPYKGKLDKFKRFLS